MREIAGMDAYAYVLNDPILYADALGMLSQLDRWIQNGSDFAGGFGDFTTGNITHWLRNQFTGIYGENGGVNVCSGFYTGGQIAGAAWQAAFITAGILNAIEAGLTAGELEAGAQGGIGPVLQGQAGMDALDVVQNTERIGSLTETAEYRIPDILDHAASVIGEVKNVAYQGLSPQILDDLLYAQKYGYDSVLVVRQTTVLSGPLQNALGLAGTTINYLPW